jgi:hypothetical protein
MCGHGPRKRDSLANAPRFKCRPIKPMRNGRRKSLQMSTFSLPPLSHFMSGIGRGNKQTFWGSYGSAVRERLKLLHDVGFDHEARSRMSASRADDGGPIDAADPLSPCAIAAASTPATLQRSSMPPRRRSPAGRPARGSRCASSLGSLQLSRERMTRQPLSLPLDAVVRLSATRDVGGAYKRPATELDLGPDESLGGPDASKKRSLRG